MKAMKSFARMDVKNQALCYTFRNPPPGVKKTPFDKIPDHVVKTDGTPPSIRAIKDAVYSYNKGRKKVGLAENFSQRENHPPEVQDAAP